MINPYFYQQPNYPVYTQPTQTLNGRLIDDPNTITANDVSMQGISVFPKNDLSEIYVKSWTPQGTIQTYRYQKMTCNAPVIAQADSYPSDGVNVSTTANTQATDGIMERLNTLESKIDQLLKPKARK